jgi:hypothetical protein
VNVEYEKYRHGSNPPDRNVGGDPDRPKGEDDSPDVSFLDGILKKQETYGISFQYEFVRNFYAMLDYRRIQFERMKWDNLISFRISLNFGYREENNRHIFPAVD